MNTRLKEIVDEIEAARSELLTSMTDVSEAETAARADPSLWSIGEILHHLFLIESQVTTLVERQITRAREKGIGPDVSTESVIHSLDRFSIETVRDRITAPQSVTPAKDMTRAELLALLSDSRSKLREAIMKADGVDLSRMQFPHPVLGRIDMYQWILYLGKHERRHIAQIARAKGE